MTANPITITPDVSVPDALRLMREKKVRRLPVVDKRGKLVGIVADDDLLYASPSPATSLAVWEITDLLSKLKVEKVMTREVITIDDDCPLEDAARIMRENAIGGLPVMRDGSLVGIITESDLFEALLELFGARRPGVRITVSAIGEKGTLAAISGAIFEAGGDIVGLGADELADDGGKHWEILFKVQGVTKDELVAAVEPLVEKVLDVRES
jgi:acetoin utilization protein AcuB